MFPAVRHESSELNDIELRRLCPQEHVAENEKSNRQANPKKSRYIFSEAREPCGFKGV